MVKHAFLVIMLLMSAAHVAAQEDNTHRHSRQWESIIDNMAEDDGETMDWESAYDILCDLEDHPVNINAASREDLERIPFLTDSEISDIQEYIYRNGEMLSKGELAAIKSLGAMKRTLLEYFISVSPVHEKGFPSIQNLLKYGENKLLLGGNIPLYERAGDKKGYLGYKYKHNIRYDHTYGDYLRIGIVGSQDAGEPFFSGRNKYGYDFYSYYLSVRRLGAIKDLTLGRYRLGMGMGLIMNNNISFGKTMSLSSIDRSGTVIRPHSSRSSYNYLQGAAVTVGVCKNLDVMAFVSSRKFDATLNKEDNSISTIIKSGYHRTETEMNRKDNASHLVAGGNVTYTNGRFNLGASAYYASLSRMLSPDKSSPFRKYYASGKHFYNMSMDYGYHDGKFSFHGETATGDSHALATVNALSYRLLSNLSLNAVQRYYSYKYYSLFSQSFSEGGAVQNESGIYLGVNWQPIGKLSLSYYIDYAYFPWAKYQAKTASSSLDNMLAVAYASAGMTLSAQYRLKIREKDNAAKTALIDQTTHRARLSGGYAAKDWNIKAQFDISSMKYKDESFGYMASVKGGCSSIPGISLYATFGYFHTDDYNSRIYCYERGMAYDFYFPSYYGEGIRYALLLGCTMIRNVRLSLKAGTTDYFDRASIGTGLQQIARSSATDIQLQMEWKF